MTNFEQHAAEKNSLEQTADHTRKCDRTVTFDFVVLFSGLELRKEDGVKPRIGERFIDVEEDVVEESDKVFTELLISVLEAKFGITFEIYLFRSTFSNRFVYFFNDDFRRTFIIVTILVIITVIIR